MEIQDVVRVGQYMDFIRNQRFRTTLICHESVKINRQLHVDDVAKFSLSFSGKFQKSLPKDKLLNNVAVTFEAPGIILTIQKPILKACMSILHDRFGKPIAYEALVQEVMKLVGEKDKTVVTKALNSELNLMRLILAGMIRVHIDEGLYGIEIPSMPKTSAYIQKTAKEYANVPNLRHETHKLTEVERLVLQYLDGSHKITNISKSLEEKIHNQELTLVDEQKRPVSSKKEIQERVKKITLTALETLTRKAYLLQAEKG